MIHIHPYLNDVTGAFQSPLTESPTPNDSIPSPEAVQRGQSQVTNKRKAPSLSPHLLTPGSKIARIEQQEQEETSNSTEEEMDQKIQQHFLGE